MCTMMPPLLHQPPAPGAPRLSSRRGLATRFFRPPAQGRTSRGEMRHGIPGMSTDSSSIRVFRLLGCSVGYWMACLTWKIMMVAKAPMVGPCTPLITRLMQATTPCLAARMSRSDGEWGLGTLRLPIPVDIASEPIGLLDSGGGHIRARQGMRLDVQFVNDDISRGSLS